MPPTPGILDLYINEGMVPMVDGSLVYMRGFGDRPTLADDPEPSLTIIPHVFLAGGLNVQSRHYLLEAELPHRGRPEPAGRNEARPGSTGSARAVGELLPRRTIIAETGSTVRLRIHNRLAQPHASRDPRRAGPGQTPEHREIQPGAIAELTFVPTRAGTYAYSDSTNAPVERILGLHGGAARRPRVRQMAEQATRHRVRASRLWLCQDVDPVWGQRAGPGRRSTRWRHRPCRGTSC